MKRWLRYRWYMLQECWKLGIPLLGLIHADFHGKTDLDYINFFHRYKHCWEHWIFPAFPASRIVALPMPDRYAKEMLAHFMASCRLYGKRWVDWWWDNRGNMILHEKTRGFIEQYNTERFQANHSRYFRRPTDRYSRGP